jgi:hypothetical protein
LPDSDFEGDPRVIDGDRDSTATVDMGADELADDDGDGIYNIIDTEPTTYSNHFSDESLDPPGTTSGTILDRGDQSLVIKEEPNPDGVRITAAPSGGTTPASVSVCGGVAAISLTAGDEAVVTCGSATVQVFVGPVEVELDGVVVIEVPTGAEVTVTEVSDAQFEIQNSGSSGTIIVEYGSEVISLEPGHSILVETLQECECDLNGDGSCNILDWPYFIQDWGSTNCNDPGVECECDLNGDGSCNILDWPYFIEDWGRTDCPIP